MYVLYCKVLCELKSILSYRGSDVHTYVGISPLFIAARNGNEELVRSLVKSGASVNQVGGTQKIGPLHWAAHKELVDIAVLLIENEGDILLKDNEGRTPLSMASPALAEKMIGMLPHHILHYIPSLDCPTIQII